MPNVLHLSDTTLSGSPIRISKLLNKYSSKYRSRHIVWTPVVYRRVFETDLVGSQMTREEILDRIGWADILHFHNRWQRQELFKFLGIPAPKKPSIIQMHSPRTSEDFREEVDSGIPLAVVGQYHPRQWPEASFVVPNVVDIMDERYMPLPRPQRTIPVVSYAPSNVNAKGWDDKGYGLVMPHLKKLKFDGKIQLQLIVDRPHDVTIDLKRGADIGIDEIATGSYHMSSLEYMAMGVPCFANLDGYTIKTVKDMTGALDLPWLKANKDNFSAQLHFMVYSQRWTEEGRKTRAWMEQYWRPEALLQHYQDMYDTL